MAVGAIVYGWLAPLAGAAPAQGPAPGRNWFEFSAEEAKQGWPVEIAGVVLCYDPGWGQLYLHDGSNAIYLSPRCFTNVFTVGQRVRIQGKTTWDGTVPILTNTSVVLLESQPLPPPPELKLADLGRLHGQWVEVQGQVRVAETSRDRVTLLLHEGGRRCVVYVMQTSGANRIEALADAWVSIQGINASRIENGKLTAGILFCPGMGQVKTLQPSAEDRWRLPVTPVETLLSRPLGAWTNQPVHLSGQVTAYQPGQSITFKDPTGTLKADVIQVTPLQVNQRVDVWGFLSLGTDRVMLADAYVQVARSEPVGLRASDQPKPPVANRPVLTEIHQVRSLSREAANENQPARLRGVLTYVDTDWRVAFLQNNRDSIFLDTGQSGLDVGQWVEVTGETDGSGFAPQLIRCSVSILGQTNLPMPVKAGLQDAAEGHLDARWVEMEGVVRRVSKENQRVYLTIAGTDGSFSAIVPDFNANPAPTALVDSRIRLQGACGSTVNSRGQISGVTLHAPGFNQISVLEASPPDPFTLKPTPISKVATFNADQPVGRRVLVQGIVTLSSQDDSFFLQDASGGIRIRGSAGVEVGERVSVLGFPALLDFSPCLQEPVIRRDGTAALPGGLPITASGILVKGSFDGLRVELEAEVQQGFSATVQPRLVLRDGPVIFIAQVMRPGASRQTLELRAGSIVRVTGVCAIQASGNNEVGTFRLLLNRPEDVVLLRAAPWWSWQHTVTLAGGLGLATLLVLAWVVLLRRRVRAQTEIIRQNQKELLEISRRAGMAEVATTVLHNVGNVLNSVNVSATIIAEKIRNSEAPGLGRAVALMEEHKHELGEFVTHHPRGRHLPAFLRNLAARLHRENESLLQELSGMCKNVDHIKTIVAMQQSHARVGGVVERLDPGEVIEDALQIHAPSLTRHQIELNRQFQPGVGTISADRHQILQILVNLVANAKHACVESNLPNRQIAVRLNQQDSRIQIDVEDNGIGIAPENLVRIFSYGFTTRNAGHGFGLHSGALSARQMGGSLTVHSDGLGRGARFTLTLPASTEDKR